MYIWVKALKCPNDSKQFLFCGRVILFGLCHRATDESDWSPLKSSVLLEYNTDPSVGSICLEAKWLAEIWVSQNRCLPHQLFELMKTLTARF
jgi:hypothetical protein